MTEHVGGPETAEAVRARHERYLAMDPASGAVFAVTLGAEATTVGWVGYWETTWRGERVWECGWSVLPAFQRQGIATAATVLVLRAAAARGRHASVHAFPSVKNAASNALCARVGFERLGRVTVEYPKGSFMRSNDWRYDLGRLARPDSPRIL
jgi:RimJ/RimL family protein N-acetyltransferase